MKGVLLVHTAEGIITSGAPTMLVVSASSDDAEPTIEEVDKAVEAFGHRPCVAIPATVYPAQVAE